MHRSSCTWISRSASSRVCGPAILCTFCATHTHEETHTEDTHMHRQNTHSVAYTQSVRWWCLCVERDTCCTLTCRCTDTLECTTDTQPRRAHRAPAQTLQRRRAHTRISANGVSFSAYCTPRLHSICSLCLRMSFLCARLLPGATEALFQRSVAVLHIVNAQALAPLLLCSTRIGSSVLHTHLCLCTRCAPSSCLRRSQMCSQALCIPWRGCAEAHRQSTQCVCTTERHSRCTAPLCVSAAHASHTRLRFFSRTAETPLSLHPPSSVLFSCLCFLFSLHTLHSSVCFSSPSAPLLSSY